MTTSDGRPFHPSTTLLLKKCPLTLRQYHFLKIFSGCPLVGLFDIVNNESLSTLIFLYHLEFCILESCRLCRVDIPEMEDLGFLDILYMISFSRKILVWWRDMNIFYLDGIFFIYWCPNCCCVFKMWTDKRLK